MAIQKPSTPSTHDQLAKREQLVNELQREKSKFTKALLADNTQSGYIYDMRAFERWTTEMGFCALPATEDTVCLYVTAMLVKKLKVSTCTRRVAAVKHMHRAKGLPNPAQKAVRELLCGARRVRVEQPDQVLPLAIDELRSISKVLIQDDTPVSIRNWAMLLTGFSGALRNCNTAALMLADVEFSDKGATLNIRKSKNDQEGHGQLIGLPHGKHPETCPPTALRKWIERRGGFPGPLFTRFDGTADKERALAPERIGQIVQESIERIGLDSRLYGGHSLRAGLATEAGLGGAGELVIAAQTGHKDMSTLRQYFRRRDVFRNNACGFVDL